ncbi:MAG: ABC transporter permease, partial [Streptomycetaceae bacterium]|nr:ABC transporter permease [Streptomycetaceae bacterium]
TVFLCAKSDPKRGGCANGDVSAAERDAIRTDLQRNPAVKQLSYESKQDAYTDFKRTAPDSPVAEVLTAEQFSEAFRVDLADRKDLDAVVTVFTCRAGVQAVVPNT